MDALTTDAHDGVKVIHLSGSLTAEQIEQIEPAFETAAAAAPGRIVIDLSDVELLATPAITMFIRAMNYQRHKGGKLIFTGTQGAIDKLLHVCRLDLIMTIVHDPRAAISQAAR